jgi:cell division protein FtsQ
MKNKLAYIKVLVMVVGFIALASFSYNRHKNRNIKAVDISFYQEKQLFIQKTAVNKLLIQNDEPVKKVPVELLDLNLVEKQLESHPMIENAEVYIDLESRLHADIKQREPIARAVGNEEYYLDSKGKIMPLSDYYSARVPIILGLHKKDTASVFQLIQEIRQDLFFNQQTTMVKSHAKNLYSLRIRSHDFDVFVGKAENLKQKFMNFKAFYVKAKKDSLLGLYKSVDLQYGKQVVCKKIES